MIDSHRPDPELIARRAIGNVEKEENEKASKLSYEALRSIFAQKNKRFPWTIAGVQQEIDRRTITRQRAIKDLLGKYYEDPHGAQKLLDPMRNLFAMEFQLKRLLYFLKKGEQKKSIIETDSLELGIGRDNERRMAHKKSKEWLSTAHENQRQYEKNQMHQILNLSVDRGAPKSGSQLSRGRSLITASPIIAKRNRKSLNFPGSGGHSGLAALISSSPKESNPKSHEINWRLSPVSGSSFFGQASVGKMNLNLKSHSRIPSSGNISQSKIVNNGISKHKNRNIVGTSNERNGSDTLSCLISDSHGKNDESYQGNIPCNEGTDANPIMLSSSSEEEHEFLDETPKDKDRGSSAEGEQGDDVFDTDIAKYKTSPPNGCITRSHVSLCNESLAMSEKLKGLRCVMPPGGGANAVEFTAIDYLRLGPDEYLNDTAIDYYLRMLLYSLEKEKPEVAQRCYFFNSFFYKKLTEKGGSDEQIPEVMRRWAESRTMSAAERQSLQNYSKVASWTKEVDIFSKDYIFIPVHDHLHWSLVIICHPYMEDVNRCSSRGRRSKSRVQKRSISSLLYSGYGDIEHSRTDFIADARENPKPEAFFLHLDSLDEGHGETTTRILRKYLAHEWRWKANLNKDSVPRRWAIRNGLILDDNTSPEALNLLSRSFSYMRSIKADVPKQKNHCDCGVFVCVFAEYFLANLPPSLNYESVNALSCRVGSKYRKDYRDLFELRNNPGAGSSEEATLAGLPYPGYLTRYWFMPENASLFRWHYARIVLIHMSTIAGWLNEKDSKQLVFPEKIQGRDYSRREIIQMKDIREELDRIYLATEKKRYLSPEEWRPYAEERKNLRIHQLTKPVSRRNSHPNSGTRKLSHRIEKDRPQKQLQTRLRSSFSRVVNETDEIRQSLQENGRQIDNTADVDSIKDDSLEESEERKSCKAFKNLGKCRNITNASVRNFTKMTRNKIIFVQKLRNQHTCVCSSWSSSRT